MKFEEGTIYFSKIIIIQSLPDNERKTGTELHDDNIDRKSWFDPKLKTEIKDIRTKQELLIELIKIQLLAKEGIDYPYIHFETHGTKEGISLSSSEEVTWKELTPILLNINVETKNNLFISVASCWGGNIQKTIKIYNPCPFRGFIGPVDEIYPEELIISYTSFFDELLESNDFDRAVTNLNLHSPDIKFHHMAAEAFFDHILKISNDQQIIDKALEIEWKKPRAKMIYRSKEHLKERFQKKNQAWIPEIKQQLIDRFLHKTS